MIAPWRDDDDPGITTTTRGLRQARRLIAATLLSKVPLQPAPALAAWKSLLIAGWSLVVVAAYVALLVRSYL